LPARQRIAQALAITRRRRCRSAIDGRVRGALDDLQQLDHLGHGARAIARALRQHPQADILDAFIKRWTQRARRRRWICVGLRDHGRH
jgi:hypothetical protein